MSRTAQQEAAQIRTEERMLFTWGLFVTIMTGVVLVLVAVATLCFISSIVILMVMDIPEYATAVALIGILSVGLAHLSVLAVRPDHGTNAMLERYRARTEKKDR